MGLFLRYYLFRGVTGEDVCGALKGFYASHGRPLQQSGDPNRRIDIHEADNEWVAVELDIGWERNERRDASLLVSKRLWCPGFFIFVYHGEFWGYEFFDKGEIYDHFVQDTENNWFPGEDIRGNVDILAQHMPFLDISVIAPYIQQEPPNYFQEHRDNPFGGKVRPNDEYERYDAHVVMDFLRALLIVGAYGYAPVRFLWPLSVGMLLLEAALRKAERKRLLVAAALTVVVVAGAIVALDYDHGHDLVTSVGYYYAGRGEQLANLLASTSDYAHAVGQGGSNVPSTWDYFRQVVGQNSADLANLLLDRDTQPAITDYWNQHGRLIPLMLVPFFLLGFGRAAWLARRRDAYGYRLLVLFFLGFTLPMVFTSHVHIGRLIFAVPLICLLIAIGIEYGLLLITTWTSGRAHADERVRMLVSSAAVLMLVFVGLAAWNDYSVKVPTTREARITQELIKDAAMVRQAKDAVALVAVDDPTQIYESIDANQYRLGLQDYYCFYNLASSQETPCLKGDPRPTLLVGSLLARMKDPAKVPGYCTDIYYVSPNLLDRFLSTTREHQEQCPQPLRYKVLGD